MTDFTSDFTREQLKKIELGLYLLQHRGGHGDLGNLIARVAFLIDTTYCEHENDSKFNTLPYKESLKMCKLCGRFYQ